MKFKSIVVILTFLLSFSAYPLPGNFLDYFGYMRAGSGTNGKGGDQVCISNGGASGNEFRLGNECENYGEIAFRGNHLKSKTGNGKFFYSQIRLAASADGHTNWEAPGVAMRELYFEGGRFGELPLTYWAGKRFYRENDLWMNDWYYFADTSGVGGGVGNIPTGIGKLHLAQLREVGTTTSEIGRHGVTLWDARLKDIKITGKDKLMIWAGYAHSPDGKQGAIEYDSSKGHVFGVLWDRSLVGGFNHFSVLYGKGLLDEFSLYGTAALEKGSEGHRIQEKSNRLRFVEHLTLKPLENIEFHAAATMELRDYGTQTAAREIWYNVGVSPLYYFTDHYQLAFQAGYSVVDRQLEKKRTLTRFAIAPQVSVSKSIWGRPQLRAFYAKTFWNRANRGQIDNGGPYESETSASNWGLQGEVWF